MKIIKTDNCGRSGEHPGHDEVVIADNVSEYWAARIVLAMNAKYSGEQSENYFAAVNDTYQLKRFEP